MSFLHPSFLWALLALAIPIIVHLFNFRKFKTVYFTNVKFLREVKEETNARSKIKHWLILLSRLLAVAFLVFAFAQPFFKTNSNAVVTGNKAISIFIDNSFSMKAKDHQTSLFDKAKQKALEIAEAYGPEDRFQIINHNIEGKHQRLLSIDDFKAELDRIEISPNVNNLSKIHSRQTQVLEKSTAIQKNIFYISDFQKSIVDLETDRKYNYYMLPIQAENVQNVFVDSCWFAAPVQLLNQSNQLIVRIKNIGSTTIENSKIEVKVNNQTKAISNATLPAKQSTLDTLNFIVKKPGWHKATININDYPIVFDDEYFFTFFINKNINVLSINENSNLNNKNIETIFNEQAQINLKNTVVNKIVYTQLKQNQLIILNELKNISSGLISELQSYVKNGGSVLIVPNIAMNVATYNQLAKNLKINNFGKLSNTEKNVTTINAKQEIFADVFDLLPRNLDLPFAKNSFIIDRTSNSNEQKLLTFNDNKTMISKYAFEKGKVYLSAVPFNKTYTNLSSHAIFLPMILKMVLVAGKNYRPAYIIGEDNVITTQNISKKADEVFKLTGNNGEFIPAQKPFANNINLELTNAIIDAGIYELKTDNTKNLGFFAFNYNRKESDLSCYNKKDLQNLMEGRNIKFIDGLKSNIGNLVGSIGNDGQLWKICIIMALIFLAIEVLLLRFWK